MISRVPSNPNHSVILWLHHTTTPDKAAYAAKQTEIFPNGTLYFRLRSVLPTVLDRQLSLFLS